MWQIKCLDQAEEISVRKKKNEVKDKKKEELQEELLSLI